MTLSDTSKWQNSFLRQLNNILLKGFLIHVNSNRFWWIGSADRKKKFVLQTFNGTKDHYLLFDGFDGQEPKDAVSVDFAKKFDGRLKLAGQECSLPTFLEFEAFVKDDQCPLRTGSNFLILNKNKWHTSIGPTLFSHNGLSLIQDFSVDDNYPLMRVARILTSDVLPFFILYEKGYEFFSTSNYSALNLFNWASIFPDLDARPVRQPKLDTATCTERDKGIWELWGLDLNLLKKMGVRSRDPELDVRTKNIAIDFGTSSTVVAIAETDGSKRLLRIGAQDYLSAPNAADYENPTVLEFIDFTAFLRKWQNYAYRPQLDWNHTRCAHEALHDFRNNESDPAACASTLTKLKQWAIREATDSPVYITDRAAGLEYQLPPLTLRTPVKGTPLQVDITDPFDPIELYAWYLGMIINWRGNGIHLNYYMTFPVAYPQLVKDKILASFKRGLQRSFPEPFTRSPSFNDFWVEERAAEPAAFAACALRTYQIQPSKAGTAYAVFDFGGGTTDFDFGFYRTPTEDELDQEYEAVLEHFAPAGDKFLGGENLLENMAYIVFQENLAQCREKRIAFTQPMDAQPFVGYELLLDKTQAASTNTMLLIERLRPMWEQGEYTNSTGVEKLNLINKDGIKTPCELKIPKEKLADYLRNRIGNGIKEFLVAMKLAFSEKIPKIIHVLLAGNACRTKWVMDFFRQVGRVDN
ncbi:hypothetical protein V8J88_12945 [Massilia sp. W12]|uniref:hypothetical protein n=1 Tax=Massilia sp. W12 TaxID=3126507 RepID=UPI0030D054D6